MCHQGLALGCMRFGTSETHQMSSCARPLMGGTLILKDLSLFPDRQLWGSRLGWAWYVYDQSSWLAFPLMDCARTQGWEDVQVLCAASEDASLDCPSTLYLAG